MKQTITYLILMLTFAACGDVAKKPSRMTNDESQMTNEEGRGTRSALRDASHLMNDENNLMNDPSEITHDELRMTNKEERTTRGDRRIENEGDNMRGFDPASEDDGDDNGMSRYMENDDEEGWD